ncbi:MAG TPA: hypothetical protein VHO25_07955, partial [Polyangiaceae bacterium]|nr:hypothetical protein [Polyangiaceae bacterium]
MSSPRFIPVALFVATAGVCCLRGSSAHAQAAEAPPAGTTEPAAGATAPAASAATDATATGSAPADPAAPPASAQTEEQKEELKPVPQKMQLQVPTVPPAVERTVRVHRGFYLGVNAGIGHNSGSYDDDHATGESLDASGFNLGMDLLIGHAASPGLAVGGALIGDFLSSADFERDGVNETTGSSVSLLIGPFVDGFPNPNGPLHLGGTLGLAHVRANDVAFDGSDVAATGLGFAAWIGYVPWVSDHFSIGLSLQLMGNVT